MAFGMLVYNLNDLIESEEYICLYYMMRLISLR